MDIGPTHIRDRAFLYELYSLAFFCYYGNAAGVSTVQTLCRIGAVSTSAERVRDIDSIPLRLDLKNVGV
jgi:hypothetical protein